MAWAFTSSSACTISGCITTSWSTGGIAWRMRSYTARVAGDSPSSPRSHAAWAPANSSMPSTFWLLSRIISAFRAAVVPMLTWSSWLADDGMESTDAGWAYILLSDTMDAAAYWAIMKPECTPPCLVRKAGSPSDRAGFTSRSSRRSDTLAYSARAMPRKSMARATGCP